jgi:hypothetical protein
MKRIKDLPVLEDEFRSKQTRIIVYGIKGKVIFESGGEKLLHATPRGPGIEIFTVLLCKNPTTKKDRKSLSVTFIPWRRITRLVFEHASVLELLDPEQKKVPDDKKGYV